MRLADSMTDLLGMQPRRMHSPPTSSPPSMTSVVKPSAAAVRAAAKPALPPPMTTKSYSMGLGWVRTLMAEAIAESGGPKAPGQS